MRAYYANMKTPGIITKIAKEADVYGNKKNTGSRSGNKLMRILKKGSSKTNPKDLTV